MGENVNNHMEQQGIRQRDCKLPIALAHFPASLSLIQPPILFSSPSQSLAPRPYTYSRTHSTSHPHSDLPLLRALRSAKTDRATARVTNYGLPTPNCITAKSRAGTLTGCHLQHTVIIIDWCRGTTSYFQYGFHRCLHGCV